MSHSTIRGSRRKPKKKTDPVAEELATRKD